MKTTLLKGTHLNSIVFRSIHVICITLLMITINSSCTKFGIEEGTPPCIIEKIKEFKKTPLCMDQKVDKYSFQEKIVYVFDEGSCGDDMSAGVIDSECNYLGHLGGLDGNGEINGENFKNAVFIKTIWKKQK
ncbi:MAG: hypothetical protein GX612_10050 [Bacteroidales bacterium]|jgi:hypothetical protein|nr:hypothetical protein [Bacteroidales bacterium]OQA91905.1 MAG: hypothetical protein BWY27_00454 [Bacteroidetes bacterium ADurb.Bin234]